MNKYPSLIQADNNLLACYQFVAAERPDGGTVVIMTNR
jgi:hypothetical protein